MALDIELGGTKGLGLLPRVGRLRYLELWMVKGLSDLSPRGWWLRCVAPGCQGKRDLGNEPGRALGLLTQPRRGAAAIDEAATRAARRGAPDAAAAFLEQATQEWDQATGYCQQSGP